jgi:phage baseplate assembly protein V
LNLPDLIKRIVAPMLMQMGQTRYGNIISVDPNTYTARVMIQPDNVPTGWLPIKSEWIGNGWGLVAVPNTGDQVSLIPHDGDANNLVIVGRVYSQQQRPPVGVPGEFWLVHVSGAFIKLTNAGAIEINGQVKIDATAPTINITATEAVNVVAPSILLGKSLSDTLQGFCTALFKQWADAHVHSNGNGGGNTGPPTTTAATSSVTSVVKGE